MSPFESLSFKGTKISSETSLKLCIRLGYLPLHLRFKALLPNGSAQVTEDFFKKIIEHILAFLVSSNDRSEKVLDFHHPYELEKLIDFSIPKEPQDLQRILNDCKLVLDYSVKTGIVRMTVL